jgi:hypothetical protein
MVRLYKKKMRGSLVGISRQECQDRRKLIEFEAQHGWIDDNKRRSEQRGVDEAELQRIVEEKR